MKKRKERKNESKDLLDASPFGSYRNYFEPLKKGEARALKDKKSAKHSFLPIRVGEEGVFLAEPDGKLIPELPNQRKCDFLPNEAAGLLYRTERGEYFSEGSG